MSEYTDGFKSKMVQRMLGPNARSASSLSRELGIPQPTLSRWLTASQRSLASMSRSSKPSRTNDSTSKRAEDWPAEERLRVVTEAGGLSEQELGAFLRKEGLHAATLQEWREAALQGLASSKVSRSEARHVKELERELRRKDRALAEAAALLVLQKKVQSILAAADDDAGARNDE